MMKKCRSRGRPRILAEKHSVVAFRMNDRTRAELDADELEKLVKAARKGCLPKVADGAALERGRRRQGQHAGTQWPTHGEGDQWPA